MAYLPPLNGGRLNATIAGNTTGTGSLVSSGTLTFAGGNNITLSQNGNGITISGPNAAGSVNFSAGSTSANLAAVTFASSNGVGFGLNAGVITASHNGITSQSVQTQNMVSFGGSTGNIVVSNANNVTFGGAGSVVTASASFSQSVQTQGLQSVNIGGNTAGATANISSGALSLYGGNNITLSQNANSLTIAGAAGGGAGSVSFSAGTASANLGSIVFSNSNGVSFGLNGSTLTASAAGGGGVGIAGGGTTYTSGTANLSAAGGAITIASAAGSVFNFSVPQVSSIVGVNGINISSAGSTISIDGSAVSGAGGVALGNSAVSYDSGTVRLLEGAGAISIGSTSLGAGINGFNFSVPATSSFSVTGALSMSKNGSTLSLGAPAFSAGMSTLGNTTGTTGLATNQLVLAGGNNITLSQSTGAGGNTITIAAGGGGGGATLSRWEYPNVFTNLSALVNGSLSIQHMYLPFNLVGGSAKIGGSLNVNTSTGAVTGSANISLWMGIYTMSGSTLSLASSGSANNAFTWQGASASTASLSTVTGMRQLTVPMSVSMSAGDYWVAAAASIGTTNLNAAYTMYGNFWINTSASGAALMPIGSTINNGIYNFQGIYTTTATAGPASIGTAAINNVSSAYVQRAAFYNAIYNATY